MLLLPDVPQSTALLLGPYTTEFLDRGHLLEKAELTEKMQLWEQEIAKQDYILTPGRYVGIEEQEDDGEPFDKKMKRLTSELSEMFKKSHELEDEIREKLGAIGYEI